MKKVCTFISIGLLFSSFLLAQDKHASEADFVDILYGTKSVRMNRESMTVDYLNNKKEATYSNKNVPGLIVKSITLVVYVSDKKVREHLIEISSKQKLTEDLTIRFPVKSLENINRALMPMKNGTVREEVVNSEQIASYRCAGKQEKYKNDLALPMLISETNSGNIAVLTDPYFSASYEKRVITWCYPKEVGLEETPERRTILEAEDVNDIDEGMETYYQTILKDVHPGPEWTKDIAMVSYDYMSDNGKGWYNDIDTLVKITMFEDRQKIALCIHGWYDVAGRYSFNEKEGKMDDKWVSLLRGFEISLSDLHHRINYAKERGFKVLMYFADGILSSDGLPDYKKSEAMFERSWNGPDILGRSYLRNLAFDRHVNFYRNYAKALFTEFAAQVDGFVWDETYYIMAGYTGTEYKRGYLPRTQMRLVKEITGILHSIAPGKAFLTSDLIAEEGDPQNNVPPYGLMSDGTYQDSQCIPSFWSYGIFPNYRNVLWSCNWHPVLTFRFTVFGVETYNTPVVFTNGWGEDKGFSEMSPTEQKNFMRLFDYRKQFKTKLNYFTTLPPYYDFK